jgi:asparagine synthase (glutamine-hydrolysing)
MCGIIGLLSKRPSKSEDLSITASTMIDSVRHRGPDGQGIWVSKQENCALGHARLAIIDLTNEGRQPMVSHNGNLVLTMNGEIYNYVEMRHELEHVGIGFRGTSDTEVLLAAIEKWGIEAALRRTNGMFALAVLDLATYKLWLGRDRVGKKPLYFINDPSLLVFSSEIKGILAVPDIDVTISKQALADYLSLGYVVGPNTIYSEINEVPPGSLLEFDLKTQSLRESIYWHFPEQTSMDLTPLEIRDETEKRLFNSIKLRLRADVPVGVFLSGGIDSGLITAMAAQMIDRPLKTFTVGFDDSTFDETRLAREVARRYHTEHHEIRIGLDVKNLLPHIVRAYDEPFADPSALPTFAVSKLAASYVKVVLNGEGSDELFGGYRRIFAMRLLEQARPFIDRLPQGMFDSMLKNFPIPQKFRSIYSWLYRFTRAAQQDEHTRYIQWTTDGFSENEKKLLLGETIYLKTVPTHRVLNERMLSYAGLEPLAGFMAQDFLVGMTDCLLPKIDIATMSYGLESRSPFLDYNLVQWIAQVDKLQLLAGLKTKPILRTIGEKYLPPAITKAPKRGFEIPLVRWMKHDLYSMVVDTCFSEKSLLFSIFEKQAVLNILNRHLPMDDERWAKRMWILFILAAWGETLRENRLCIS